MTTQEEEAAKTALRAHVAQATEDEGGDKGRDHLDAQAEVHVADVAETAT